ncbi:uncharacterized protein CTHT_0008390 [Thermochaetoides thermophila DSM 1495]|uniref:Uncharacterized protein n=1 Tax=Chaetomium thermophilum (strain DSM 1495 / CBS 144.50 / IMI 039719) TaxID=759272 RepID=G0S015_CHATD|nr:hypothetical protein CTHT_0008390 [Thermochaetoides thermophila DSM 1495]EGS23176.1 hypothetical protein CTHT_0008390 [Thermochaetoides thermophila DSM 1495]
METNLSASHQKKQHQQSSRSSFPQPRRDTVIVDIASLLRGSDSNESSATRTQQPLSSSISVSAPVTSPPIGPTPPAPLPTTLATKVSTVITSTSAPAPAETAARDLASSSSGLIAGGTIAKVRGHSTSAGGAAGQQPVSSSRGVTTTVTSTTVPTVTTTTTTSSSSSSRSAGGTGGSKRSMPPHTSESPAKKQSKWSPEEDALIIELRGSGMKWDDISKRLPGRSSISCRLHYQNYLERRSEWDEERKNKLARLYERFKPEMWAKVAEEMQVPWRAAEAMHWQLASLKALAAFPLPGRAMVTIMATHIPIRKVAYLATYPVSRLRDTVDHMVKVSAVLWLGQPRHQATPQPQVHARQALLAEQQTLVQEGQSEQPQGRYSLRCLPTRRSLSNPLLCSPLLPFQLQSSLHGDNSNKKETNKTKGRNKDMSQRPRSRPQHQQHLSQALSLPSGEQALQRMPLTSGPGRQQGEDRTINRTTTPLTNLMARLEGIPHHISQTGMEQEWG